MATSDINIELKARVGLPLRGTPVISFEVGLFEVRPPSPFNVLQPIFCQSQTRQERERSSKKMRRVRRGRRDFENQF